LNGAIVSLENKKAEEKRLQDEIFENEKKVKLFQERSLQLAEYRQFYYTEKDLILTTETDAVAFEELMKNLVLRKNEYLIERERIAKENENLKKQNEESQKQIEDLKTIIKIEQTPTEQVEPTIVKREIVDDTEEDYISIKKSEYEVLRIRYGIAKTALESVLYFIVPQNLRDLVNKALKEIEEVR
jgi:hypothetical protein